MHKAFLDIVRVNGDEGTPVPIPNTVVKLIYGDNTWLATAREDNSTRTSKQQLRLLLFFIFLQKIILFGISNSLNSLFCWERWHFLLFLWYNKNVRFVLLRIGGRE